MTLVSMSGGRVLIKPPFKNGMKKLVSIHDDGRQLMTAARPSCRDFVNLNRRV